MGGPPQEQNEALVSVWYYLTMGFTSIILGYATYRFIRLPFDLYYKWKKPEEETETTPIENGNRQRRDSGGSTQSTGSKKAAKKAAARTLALAEKMKSEKEKFQHPWLLASLKSHSGNILDLDLSSNEKLLASCADDRTILVWLVKDLEVRDHKNFRANIPFDHSTFVRWSPDNTAVLGTRVGDRSVEVFRIQKKPNDNAVAKVVSHAVWQCASTTPKSAVYIGLGVACTGKFVMIGLSDGHLEIRDVKGVVLTRSVCGLKDPVLAKVTPCGRFVAVASAKDLEIIEVKVTQDGVLGKAELASKWTLKPGAIAPMTDFAFNRDSSKVVMVFADGSWLTYDTTGNRVNVDSRGAVSAELENAATVKPVVAMTIDGELIAVGMEHNVYFFSAFSGKCIEKLLKVYKGDVTRIVFGAESKTVFTSGDNVIHVFKNVPYFMEKVDRLKAQLNDASLTATMRGRLADDLKAFENELKKV